MEVLKCSVVVSEGQSFGMSGAGHKGEVLLFQSFQCWMGSNKSLGRGVYTKGDCKSLYYHCFAVGRKE
jgi:hypothetical protein